MTKRSLLGGLVFAGVLVLVAGRVVSQDKPETPGGTDPTAAWMQANQPGEFHTLLKASVGRWNVETKFWSVPGMAPTVSSGISETRMIMGGRYLVEDFRGDVMGSKFEGMGITGYDNFKKKFTSMWIDNMNTAIMTQLGTCDESRKVFTYFGECDDPMTGGMKKIKTVTRLLGKNRQMIEMFDLAPDGKEFKTMELIYTRISSKPAT